MIILDQGLFSVDLNKKIAGENMWVPPQKESERGTEPGILQMTVCISF